MLRSHRYLPALLLVIGVGIATPACAAQGYQYGYPGGRNGGYGREIERRAYETGYRDGVQEGQNDARRGRDFSYSRHNEYRDADDGYRARHDRPRLVSPGVPAGVPDRLQRVVQPLREEQRPLSARRSVSEREWLSDEPRRLPFAGRRHRLPRRARGRPQRRARSRPLRPASGPSAIAKATTTTTAATARARTTSANTAPRSSRDTARGTARRR